MALFFYRALTAEGRKEKGWIEADSLRQARQRLREKGVFPVVVESRARGDAGHATDSATTFTLRRRRSRRLSATDLALLTRQLATLVQAALPLESSLKAVAEQSEKVHVQSLILAVRARVMEGHTFADSLRAHPHIFDSLYCAMVAAGEKTGHLDTVLNRLADYTEQRQQLAGKLLQALLYPLVLTCVAIGVIALLLASVVPKVVGQFEHLGQALPPSTQLLIALSDLTRDFGGWALLVFIVMGMGVKRVLKHPHWRLCWDQRWLALPVVGRVCRGLNTARFARTLSILAGSKVPLLESLAIAASVSSNRYVEQQIKQATERVREGSALRTALTASQLFPPMMLHMIASGERSGELDHMLARAADNQEREFAALMTLAVGIFEPLLIITMAGMVLFIVVAILQPMLQLNNMIG